MAGQVVILGEAAGSETAAEWVARFVTQGRDVVLVLPGPGAEAAALPPVVAEVLASARAVVPLLSDHPVRPEGRLTVLHPEASQAALAGAALVLLAGACAVLPADIGLPVVALDGMLPPDPLAPRGVAEPGAAGGGGERDLAGGLAAGGLAAGERGHGAEAAPAGLVLRLSGASPAYLLPLAEMVPLPGAAPGRVAQVADLLRAVGLRPVLSPHGAVAPRMMAAARAAAAELLPPGAAGQQVLDEILAMGLGPGWAAAGVVPAAGPVPGARPGPVTGGAVGDYPPGAAADLSGRETLAARDRRVAAVLRALMDRNMGAGRALRAHDLCRPLPPQAEAAPEDGAPGDGAEVGPLVTARLEVLPAWIDYNGHMTESRYLAACSEITDGFIRRIGVDLDYVARGMSYYSVETHLRHLGEAKLGDRLEGSVQVLGADARRLHLFVRIARGGQVLATLEQMLLHVDMAAGRACPAPPAVMDRLMPLVAAQAGLARPEGAGRFVGQARSG